MLTHWGRVKHICVGKLTIIGSDNGLSPERHQAIIWTNAAILLIGPLGTNFSEILIEIQTFSLKKIRLKMSSAKCCSFRLGLNVLTLVLVMTCVLTAPSHYMIQCWLATENSIGFRLGAISDGYIEDITQWNVFQNFASVWYLYWYPQCTGPSPNNALFRNKNVHMCAHFCCVYCVMYCRIYVWCIVEFTNMHSTSHDYFTDIETIKTFLGTTHI